MFAAMTELLSKYSKNKSLRCYYSVISSFILWLPFSSKPIIILLPVIYNNLILWGHGMRAFVWVRAGGIDGRSKLEKNSISVSYKQAGKHTQKWILIRIHDW